MGTLRGWLCVGGLVLAGVVGCGSTREAPPPDQKPFEAAIVEYLRVGTMDMKPDKFESLEVKDDSATAKVRMATKDDLYGMKPVWTFTFRKEKKGWEVTGAAR
jgi:hypothetical protein